MRSGWQSDPGCWDVSFGHRQENTPLGSFASSACDALLPRRSGGRTPRGCLAFAALRRVSTVLVCPLIQTKPAHTLGCRTCFRKRRRSSPQPNGTYLRHGRQPRAERVVEVRGSPYPWALSQKAVSLSFEGLVRFRKVYLLWRRAGAISWTVPP
jgi:hypothetical protein